MDEAIKKCLASLEVFLGTKLNDLGDRDYKGARQALECLFLAGRLAEIKELNEID